MRERRISEREGCLLDDDVESSSTNSEPENCNWVVLTAIFIIQVCALKANNKVVPVSQTEGCGFKSPRILILQFSN
jgi:hypothetical protein